MTNSNYSFSDHYREELVPLYDELIRSVSQFDFKKDVFASQWGRLFPLGQKEGILFVGRATNSWITTDLDIKNLFGPVENKHCIFNCTNQMTWVYDCAGPRPYDSNGKRPYNTNRSAFWRVIRSVASNYYPVGQELNYVAWSNVCKIQADSGNNPFGLMFDLQIPICKRIFEVDIRNLSPKYVVLFTGGYGEREILSHMNGGTMPIPLNSKQWDNFNIDVYQIDATYYLCTEHPQGKGEYNHIQCINSLIDTYK